MKEKDVIAVILACIALALLIAAILTTKPAEDGVTECTIVARNKVGSDLIMHVLCNGTNAIAVVPEDVYWGANKWLPYSGRKINCSYVINYDCSQMQTIEGP